MKKFASVIKAVVLGLAIGTVPFIPMWTAFAFATDPIVPPPDIWIPVVQPPIPPTPPLPTNSVTVPVGSFMPLYVSIVDSQGKPVPTRIRFSDPSVFAAKRLKLAKGATVIGTLFTATEPDVFTMAADGYVFTAVKAGVTTLTVDANSNDGPIDKLSVTITVGTPVPPPPPVPSDSFTASLQAAYTADTGSDKAASLAFLQGAYASMAKNPKAVATNAEALAWLQSVVGAPSVGLTATQLVGVRKAIAVELSSTMTGTATAPVDGVKFAFELGKISTALSGVK